MTHSYEMSFRGPFRILEFLHRGWLQRNLEVEMARLVDLLNR